MALTRFAPILVAAVSLVFGTASGAAADDVAVIVNRGNPITSLSMIQLRKIVLAQEAKWPSGGRIIVWMAPPGHPERSRTLKVVCGMTETDYTLHFMHASFNGDGGDPPKTAASSALVRQSIATAANGVGFIWAALVDDSVKLLAIDGSVPGQPGYKLTPK